MLKPPINNLVKKIEEELGPDVGPELGNRYSLVLAIAKRARVIAAEEEENAEKEIAPAFEARANVKPQKEVIKPIHKAIDEFYGEKIEVYHKTPEDIKAEERERQAKLEEQKAAAEAPKAPIDFLSDEDE